MTTRQKLLATFYQHHQAVLVKEVKARPQLRCFVLRQVACYYQSVI